MNLRLEQPFGLPFQILCGVGKILRVRVRRREAGGSYQPRTVDAASRTLALRCAGFGLLHRDLVNMA